MIIVFKFLEFALDWSFFSSYNCLYLKTKKVTLANKKIPILDLLMNWEA